MRTFKRIAAGIMALSTALTATTACSKDGDESSESSYEQQISVEIAGSAENITKLPGGEESTIRYMGENDLNPAAGSLEKSVELKLFEEMGGKIVWTRVTNSQRFDKLAEAIITQQEVPDIFKHEWLAFPAQITQNRYQPINSLVNFDDPLWADVKETAEQFCFKGDYYVAPLDFVPSAMIFYDKDVLTANALDDPYTLYKAGNWNWDTFHELMTDYVNGGSADEVRYGINGFFKPHIVQQTGKTMIIDANDVFLNNTTDADIEKAENFLYDISKEGLVYNDWLGSAQSCFSLNILFYGMGEWAASGTNQPQEGDNWGVVPMPVYPSNPQKITTSDMTAYMWVYGSTKGDAVKTWFECVRTAKTDPVYTETNKQTFFTNNPYWTEEMYEVKMEICSGDYLQIFDYGFGVSPGLGDRNSFDGNQCLIDALYGDVTVIDGEDGSQLTWTQVREQYDSLINSELKALNDSLADYTPKA